MSAEWKSHDNPGAFAGLLIITVGVVFLLDRNGIISAREVFGYWPAILVAAGVVKLIQPARDAASRIIGCILVVVGGILLSARYVGWGQIWPVFIIAAGGMLLWRSIEGGRRFGGARSCGPAAPGRGIHGSGWSSATRLSHWAVFSGFERQIANPEFEGGEVVAIFGGSEIDLRRAGLKNGTAVLDATAIFGGVEVRVPETWEVVLRGTGLFGGYVDSTHPLPDPSMRTGTLWVQGVALFGGVEVKN